MRLSSILLLLCVCWPVVLYLELVFLCTMRVKYLGLILFALVGCVLCWSKISHINCVVSGWNRVRVMHTEWERKESLLCWLSNRVSERGIKATTFILIKQYGVQVHCANSMYFWCCQEELIFRRTLCQIVAHFPDFHNTIHYCLLCSELRQIWKQKELLESLASERLNSSSYMPCSCNCFHAVPNLPRLC